MAFDYITLRDTVAEPLLKEFGNQGDGFLMIPGEPIGEDYGSRLDNDTECPITYTIGHFEKSENNGTLVEENDLMFLVSTEGVTIKVKLANRIVADGIEYQIVRIDPLKPGPIIMLWKVHARK